MLDKKDAYLQLEAIKSLHFAVSVLVRFIHELWDSPSLEKEVRELMMGLYGLLMTEVFPPIHKLLRDLELEWEVMYDGDPEADFSDEDDEKIIFVPEWDDDDNEGSE